MLQIGKSEKLREQPVKPEPQLSAQSFSTKLHTLSLAPADSHNDHIRATIQATYAPT